MSDTPPPLTSIARHYGPWLVAITALLAAVGGYVDLRARIDAAHPAAHPELAAGTIVPVTTPPITAAVLADGEGPAQWLCSGTIAGEMVRSVIGRGGADVIACIDARVREAAPLGGTLRASARVTRTGSVDAVHIAGPDDAPLRRCVADVILTWRFPPPVGGDCAIVDAPFATATSATRAASP